VRLRYRPGLLQAATGSAPRVPATGSAPWYESGQEIPESPRTQKTSDGQKLARRFGQEILKAHVRKAAMPAAHAPVPDRVKADRSQPGEKKLLFFPALCESIPGSKGGGAIRRSHRLRASDISAGKNNSHHQVRSANHPPL